MDSFIAAQIKDVKRTPNVRMPKPAQCMIVTKLALRSVAAAAGVAVRDFLVSLDGEPATRLVPETYVFRASEHRWTFYSRARHELLEIHATGIEPGVALQATLDGIKERYDPTKSSPTELERVWEARDWAALELLLEDGTLSATVRQAGSPFVLLLDRERRVRCEGELECVELWDTIAAVSPSGGR